MSETPVDIGLIETFHAVTRLGSVTAAARELGRSQPAVSHRLRALEEELGVQLFAKQGRGLRVTEAGRRLERRSAQLLALARGLRDAVREPDDAVAGPVVVGSLPTLSAHLLAPAVAELISRWPELRLSFTYGFVPDLCERLRTGRVDLVLAVGAEATAGLDAERIATTPLVAALCPEDAPRRGRCSVPSLRRRRYLSWGGGRDATFDIIARFAESQQLLSPFTPSVPHIETLRELVIAGAGYTILPRYVLRRDEELGRLRTCRVSGLDVELPILLVRRPGSVDTRAVEVVAAGLRDAVGMEPGQSVVTATSAVASGVEEAPTR
jgi:LysR family transcriptional regulator, nitrogen assimilation regulatory protein